MVLEMKFYRVICLASCGTLDCVLSHRERNIYPESCYRSKDSSFLHQDTQKAKQFLPFLQRAGRSEAVVEYVFSGSRLKLYLPKETCLITFLLAGKSYVFYMFLWNFFPELRGPPWRSCALLSAMFQTEAGGRLGDFISNWDFNIKFLDLVSLSLQTQHWALFPASYFHHSQDVGVELLKRPHISSHDRVRGFQT